jgi:hypothetical protein
MAKAIKQDKPGQSTAIPTSGSGGLQGGTWDRAGTVETPETGAVGCRRSLYMADSRSAENVLPATACVDHCVERKNKAPCHNLLATARDPWSWRATPAVCCTCGIGGGSRVVHQSNGSPRFEVCGMGRQPGHPRGDPGCLRRAQPALGI